MSTTRVILATTFVAMPILAQQASITLGRADVEFCNKQDIPWTLTKTSSPSGQVASGAEVTFTVTATKGTPGPNTICAFGYFEVTNTGSAPATIGNIVVNLQRQRQVSNQSRWVSASADIANASAGDAATEANILAAATQENPSWNAQYNPIPTFTAGNGNGAPGTFKENAGSGTLEFTDADLNTIWAITPKQSIPVGATVRLLFTATYKNDVLQIPDGTSLRAEVIVTFGNSGSRGGSGSSGNNIDIDGSGGLTPDEANVRSVPTRITKNLPALQKCNDSVTFNDTFSTTGNTSLSTPVWAPFLDPNALPISISNSMSWTITTTLTGDGSVSNTATLKGTDSVVNVIIGTDLTTLTPITQAFQCCKGVDLQSSVTVFVGAATPPALSYCTETHFENNSPTAQFELSFYQAAFAGGLVIGNYFPGNGNTAPNGFQWTGNATGQAALKAFITGGGGTNGALTKDLSNPTSGSGGSLARHAVTLSLNVGFSGVIPTFNSNPAWPAGFGGLKLFGTTTSLDGQTVNQILAAGNAALANGTLPVDYDFSDLSKLLDEINKSFNDCRVGAWAVKHLQ